jgi:hypothetical protein
MIYKYQKQVDQYTTYTLISPEESQTELCTVDGWTYCISGIIDLSIQPEQIQDSIEEVTLTPEENLTVKYASPVIVHRLNKINSEVNTYINSHYDQGTQSSFNGIYAKRDTSDTVKDDLDLVWGWIASVMGYYYGKKNDILTLEAFDEVTWDFSQFDATKPDVTLAGIMAELAA